ncbi:MAG: NAD(P)(+) transhydrogenase (Re/Si-specific) subunit beta, partial [Planctomycetota bacterium]|nr:NAD(P)(+) transhydrogenase (Re/Si-specific) subunit beta [Planctomycetota bacterium]
MEFTREDYINLAYVIAGVMFIFGLKGLTHPRTAVRGNLLGASGMLIAIVATLLVNDIASYSGILVGIIIGGAIGGILGVKIEMTAMPQLVAVFNGFGGGASVLVAWAELMRAADTVTEAAESTASGDTVVNIAVAASGIIGVVTFWGSLIAFGKLQELDMFKKPIHLNGHQMITIGVAALSLLLAVFVAGTGSHFGYFVMIIAASALGILLVVPIGGADMPVVIALL